VDTKRSFVSHIRKMAPAEDIIVGISLILIGTPLLILEATHNPFILWGSDSALAYVVSCGTGGLMGVGIVWLMVGISGVKKRKIERKG
jgi:hypothetical protein